MVLSLTQARQAVTCPGRGETPPATPPGNTRIDEEET
jgi:hypothetical protein